MTADLEERNDERSKWKVGRLLQTSVEFFSAQLRILQVTTTAACSGGGRPISSLSDGTAVRPSQTDATAATTSPRLTSPAPRRRTGPTLPPAGRTRPVPIPSVNCRPRPLAPRRSSPSHRFALRASAADRRKPLLRTTKWASQLRTALPPALSRPARRGPASRGRLSSIVSTSKKKHMRRRVVVDSLPNLLTPTDKRMDRRSGGRTDEGAEGRTGGRC